MGKFNEQIAWLKERRETALEEIADIEAGVRYMINGSDRTEKHLKRAQQDVKRFEQLIAAYEDLDIHQTWEMGT